VAPVRVPEVVAAGGVVTRPATSGPGGIEVLVVHRPRYDDWTFPKGKLEQGETLEECAVREVREETGIEVELANPIGTIDYEDRKRRPKRVHYWAMSVIDGAFVANEEVDELRWLTPVEARALLTFAHDAELLDRLGGGQP
jgi:8-oxo-dGTP diphosphatase